MSIRYSNARRLELAVAREAELLTLRAAMSDGDIAELIGVEVGDDVPTSAAVYPWAEFVTGYRSGAIANGHRHVIENGGAR